MCWRCGRPSSVCLCPHIREVETRTRVVILQHPRERSVPINTARLAEVGLTNAERLVGVEFDERELARALSGGAPPILLFPGPEARPLAEARRHGPVTLVVLDGTWWQAQKLLKTNPSLAHLPRYRLNPAEPSRYRIRRAPSAECISTIEAIVEALTVLEGDECPARALLAPFDALVEQQLTFKVERAERRHWKRPRPPRAPRLPQVPLQREHDAVVVYGEANGWSRHSPFGAEPEIVHLAAERLATGERFCAYVAPELPLAPSLAHHTGLDPERIRDGEPRDVVNRRWREFLGSNALLCAWGHFALKTLAAGGGAVPEVLDIRSVARNFLGKSPGEVESCAVVLGANPEPAWTEGRTGRRLAALSTVTRALFSIARAHAADTNFR